MYGKNFIICGLAGWCLEVAFTSADAIRKKDKKMTGKSSAWMFPIYGMASGIGFISPKIAHWPMLCRAFLYGSAIMTTEYITGRLLSRYDACPWCYDGCKYAIKDVVRLDYLPLWMCAGLLYEKLLQTIDDTHSLEHT